MIDLYWRNLQRRRWFLLAVTLHVVAAWFSRGYLHPDEHCQIVVPMAFKLEAERAYERKIPWCPPVGTEWQNFSLPRYPLTWDFRDKIRPWAQIALYLPLGMLAKGDPFFTTFLLRLFTCLFALFSLAFLGKCLFINDTTTRQLWWCRFLALTWFLPFLQARASSENLAAAFAFLAMGLVLVKPKHFLWAGLSLGASFLVRYQMGIIALCVFFWLALVERCHLRALLHFCLGVLLALPIGLVIDRWGYGEWTLAPWNYFVINILQDKASNWGTSPWYYYAQEWLLAGIPPLSLFFLGVLLLFVKRYPKSVLTFAIVPFTLVHCLIPHKELRFLIFVAELLPLLAALVFTPPKRTWIRYSLAFPLTINCLALAISCIRPLNTSMFLYRYLYDNHANHRELKVINLPEHPFYIHSGINIVASKNLAHETGSILSSGHSQFELLNSRPECQRIYGPFPPWLMAHVPRSTFKRSSLLTLWSCLD